MLFTNRLASHDLRIGQMVEKHMQVQNRSSEEHQRVAKSFYIYPKTMSGTQKHLYLAYLLPRFRFISGPYTFAHALTRNEENSRYWFCFALVVVLFCFALCLTLFYQMWKNFVFFFFLQREGKIPSSKIVYAMPYPLITCLVFH